MVAARKFDATFMLLTACLGVVYNKCDTNLSLQTEPQTGDPNDDSSCKTYKNTK